MKKILVISGKGGTGKTVVSGAFAALAENKILVDCDVDSANLHLLMQPRIEKRELFCCGQTASIRKDQCVQCGLCRQLCRFDAIGSDLVIDPIACEGCGLCKRACPQEAIEMQDDISGEWFVSDTRYGTFVHAKLGVAQENSGKLVSLIKQKAKEIAEAQGCDWMIIDGAPGIGCPVIASLSGVDCAVVVTEPTRSGLHDADRVVKVARHFQVPVKLVINRYDLSREMTQEIEKHFQKEDVEIVGKIPFDRTIVEATVQGRTIIEHSNTERKRELGEIWNLIK